MENIDIVINKRTRMIQDLPRTVIGNDGENLQENLVFSFEDEFAEGQARLEVLMPDKTKEWYPLTQVEETYQLPVKSILTKIGKIYMQVVVDEGTDENSVPIFKSNIFYVIVNKSINAVGEAPEGYTLWLEIANAKINEMNLLMQDLQAKVESGYFNGKDALINGFNTLEIVAGNNIIIEQVGNQLIISAVGVSPLPDNHLETSDGNIFKTIDDAYFIVKESD